MSAAKPLSVRNGDQGWVAVKRILNSHVGLTEDAAKAVSQAVADELVRRGHLHTLEATRQTVAAEVRAVRQALR